MFTTHSFGHEEEVNALGFGAVMGARSFDGAAHD
jgi:hypothetical protein